MANDTRADFIIELESNVIVEGVGDKQVKITGITLVGPVTRNNNLYRPNIKRKIASDLIGKPIIFGSFLDHINPIPGEDVQLFIGRFPQIAAKFIVGHITESIYDPKIDAIRYVGMVRNTADQPDVADRTLAKDLSRTSVGAIGKREKIVHPKFGAVNDVVYCEVTHMAYVTIPGDRNSEILSAIITESFDPKHRKLVLEAMGERLDEHGNPIVDPAPVGLTEEKLKELLENLKINVDNPSAVDLTKIANELEAIRIEKDNIAKKLGLSEQEKKKLEDDAAELAANAPTKAELEEIQKQLGDLDVMRSEINKYKEESAQRVTDRVDAKIEDVIKLSGLTDADAIKAKTEELSTMSEAGLDIMRGELSKINTELEEARKQAQRAQRSTGAVALRGSGYGTPESQSYGEQYKKLAESEKNRLWQRFRVDTIQRIDMMKSIASG